MIHRRTFLQRSTLVLAGLSTPLTAHTQPNRTAEPSIPSRTVPFPGRAFTLTALYDSPDGSPRADGLGIAPDSVHMVHEITGGWYRLDQGWVPASALQPISPYQRPALLSDSDAPRWVTVIAASTAVQAWCAVDAPILASVGYGAVFDMRGTLIDDYGAHWYEVGYQGGVGWGRGLHCAAIDLTMESAPEADRRPSNLQLVIDRQRRMIRLFVDNVVTLRTPYYGGPDLDRLAMRTDVPIGTVCLDRPGENGVPWIMMLTCVQLDAPIRVCGAWDHHNFGYSGGGVDLTLAPEAAQALYLQILNGCSGEIADVNAVNAIIVS